MKIVLCGIYGPKTSLLVSFRSELIFVHHAIASCLSYLLAFETPVKYCWALMRVLLGDRWINSMIGLDGSSC